MRVNGLPQRSIWLNDDGWSVNVIDQTRLPHAFEIINLKTLEAACTAIRDMVVRGAPLIGITAAYGYSLALRQNASNQSLQQAYRALLATRPTAVNLRWALERMQNRIEQLPCHERAQAALKEAQVMADQDIKTNRRIGEHGLEIIRQHAVDKTDGEPVNILTHCNAGWLATVDWGTATAPIYLAHDEGIPLHIWVDETRPRNQGAHLTAWELGHHGIPHSLISDNTGGHLMQHDLVDLCLVGSDRTAANGDVCNKIGTYLKALSARDNGIPFYVCLPSSTIDWSITEGRNIPIEQRDDQEILEITGKHSDGSIKTVSIAPDNTVGINYAFDVTPARLITGLITEKGVSEASRSAMQIKFQGSPS